MPSTDLSYQNEQILVEQKGSLINDFRSLLFDSNSSDFTIVTQSERIPVHKLILQARSAVLKAMFESGMHETVTNEMIISEFSAEVVRAFVQFLYTDDCRSVVTNANVISLFKISHIYEVIKLMHFCERHMIESLTSECVVERLLLADKYERNELKIACTEYIESSMRL